MRIPDSVLRITRHKGRGIETEAPGGVSRWRCRNCCCRATPISAMRVRALCRLRHDDPGRAADGAEGQSDRTGARLCRPRHRRYRTVFPELTVTLDGDGRDYDAVAAERAASAGGRPCSLICAWRCCRPRCLAPMPRNAGSTRRRRCSSWRIDPRIRLQVPVLVDDAGVLIAGHGRVLAAKALGLASIPQSGWGISPRRRPRPIGWPTTSWR